MKKFLLILLLISGCSNKIVDPSEIVPPAPAPQISEPVVEDNYEKAISHKDKKVLIVFGADWCVYCVKLKTDLASKDLKDFVVCEVNVDQREDLKKLYKVKSLPTVLILKNKKELSRMEGYDKNKFDQFLNKHVENNVQYSTIEVKLLENHNKERVSRGYKALQMNESLCKYAKNHAEKMAREENLEHSSMKDLAKVIDSNSVGENIAWGQKDEDEVVNSWMWSPGHRWNILGSDYEKVGFGTKADKNGKIYWCAVFSD